MSDCHSTAVAVNPVIVREQAPLLALAGQPNVGKSTLFNFLTGLNQHVGNWPGKTVERKEGKFSISGREYGIVDLPGTYSLTANSPEEIAFKLLLATNCSLEEIKQKLSVTISEIGQLRCPIQNDEFCDDDIAEGF